jgi:uncharacterized membrane protein required for colicin V production
MVIDILLLIVACVALLYGWRKGAVVLLLQLVGIYVAILLAPDYADDVGAIITEDQGLAYLLGYAAIILGAWIVLWIIAPLFRKILFFDALRKVDSLLGMAFSFLATGVIVSVLLSLFVTANIGVIRTDKVLELGSSGLTTEQVEEYTDMIERKDKDLRDFFEPKYIDYETLDESKFFYPLANFGEEIFPSLKVVEQQMMEWTLNTVAKYDR